MTLPNKTERRAIVDTHRHPWGQKMQSKIEKRGLLDPKQGFPQTNALDLMAYREVFDLDYAMPIQREGGITLTVTAIDADPNRCPNGRKCRAVPRS
jgi:hypothetical protein